MNKSKKNRKSKERGGNGPNSEDKEKVSLEQTFHAEKQWPVRQDRRGEAGHKRTEHVDGKCILHL